MTPNDNMIETIVGFAVLARFAVVHVDAIRAAVDLGDPEFDAGYDLDGSGSVDFPDFLTFADGYGGAVR